MVKFVTHCTQNYQFINNKYMKWVLFSHTPKNTIINNKSLLICF